MREVNDGEQTAGETAAASEQTVVTEAPALATTTKPSLEVTRQALLAVLNDPKAMAPVKMAAASLAGRRGADVADDLVADVVGDTWAGDTAWDPSGAMPGAMQGHLIAAMQFRAKEMYRRERRTRSLAALPEDSEPATRDDPSEREIALAARLDRLPRLLPRLREQLLRDDPGAWGTLSRFEADMDRAQSNKPGSELSPRELRRQHHNSRRRLRRAARALEAELVEAEQAELANKDTPPTPDAVQPQEAVITSLAATPKPHLRTRGRKLKPATAAIGPTIRKRRKRSD